MTATDKASELPHLTNYLKDLYHCSDCGYCVDAIWEERDIDHICATLESHSPGLSYSGQGYIKTARAWVEGEDLPLASVSEHAFTCTSCGNCERICPIGMRPMEINRALRSELIARDLAPESAIAIQKNVLEQQNPAGAPRAERYHWAQNIETAERAELVYLPGCASAYARPQEAQAAMRLLQAAGVPVKILGDSDSCCGAPLRELGFSDDAARQSEQLGAALAKQSFNLLVTSGCECAHALANEDRQTSFAGWLASALTEGKLQLAARSSTPKVSCIESCQATLGAVPNDNQTLYDILGRLGVTVNGGAPTSRFAMCCGAGGGAPAMHPQSSTEMARARMREATAKGQPDAIVSIDPRCVAHLDAARSDGDPPVYGLAEFVDTHFHLSAEGN